LVEERDYSAKVQYGEKIIADHYGTGPKSKDCHINQALVRAVINQRSTECNINQSTGEKPIESTIRMLKDFKQKGLILLNGKSLKLVDLLVWRTFPRDLRSKR